MDVGDLSNNISFLRHFLKHSLNKRGDNDIVFILLYDIGTWFNVFGVMCLHKSRLGVIETRFALISYIMSVEPRGRYASISCDGYFAE